MSRIHRAVTIAALAMMPLLAFAQAERYPKEVVKVVVPYPAGGWFDRVARAVADALTISLKQNFIVDNRAGAGGLIGVEYVAKAAPDGYTLLLGGQAQNVTVPLLRPQVARFDSQRDFAPIALLVEAPNVLVLKGDAKARSFAELIAMVKSRNGNASFASNSAGSGSHLAMELMRNHFGLDMVHVPHKGSAPAVAAVAGGHVDMLLATIQDILPLIDSGRVHPVAVSVKQRLDPLPKVPTISEAAGVTGLESATWSALLAPAGTPPAIIRTLNAAVNKALTDPQTVKRLSPRGEMVFLGGTPEDVSAVMKAEFAKWGKVISSGNIKID